MLSIPNMITLLRIPLAFLFLKDDLMYRCLALSLALLSDVLDGYIARKYHLASKLGAILDPIADKFFVAFVLIIFMKENRLTFGEASTMISRDFSLLLFGAYLACVGRLSNYQIRAIWSGKVATFLQITVLLGLAFNVILPAYTFFYFTLLGILALIELYLTDRCEIPQPNK